MLKNELDKKPLKMTPGMTLWGSQKSSFWGPGAFFRHIKIQKWAHKKVFWVVDFLMIFWMAKNMSQDATDKAKASNLGGPGPPGSMTKVMLEYQSYRMEDLTTI